MSDDTDTHRALHTLTACLYCSSNLASDFLWPKPKAIRSNPVIICENSQGDGQDKERVNRYNKCPLSTVACQFRSNNDLCWRPELFLELNHRLLCAERESPCVECVEEAAVECGRQLDIDQTAASAGQDKGSGFKPD